MKRLAMLCLLIVALTLAAAPVPDVEGLLREGNAAFQRGDCTAAAALYEQAGLQTTEPNLVAFNLAVVKYRQALEKPESRAKGLEEAEQYFRCCLAPTDPRRGRALHYLGACVLQQALDGQPGRAQDAAALLEKCLGVPGLDPELLSEAEQNLALARLIVAQTPPPPPESPQRRQDEPPGSDRRADPKPPNKPQTTLVDTHASGDTTASNAGVREVPALARADMIPVTTDKSMTKAGRDRTPGDQETEGPDRPEARFLHDAVERIVSDQHDHKRKMATPPAPGVKDW